MLSHSIDATVRGDENTVCSKLSQYRAERIPREINKDNKKLIGGRNRFVRSVFNTNVTEIDNDNEIETDDNKDFENFIPRGAPFDIASDQLSACPVENGVIRTKWGAISGGALIAGIAAGLEPQTVSIKQVLGTKSQNVNVNLNIDNRWAATLAGNLAEIVLQQTPMVGVNALNVGAPGSWNSTTIPKWYFLSKKEHLEMTDAEIRGGLDGLILATYLNNWKNDITSVKLSQLLRMYYSYVSNIIYRILNNKLKNDFF